MLYNMSNKEILEITDDIVFKRLFGQEGEESLIKDLLEAILDINIASVELGKEVELLPETIEEKLGILDVRVKLPDGSMVDVEMQNVDRKDMEKRMTYYTSRLYTSGIKKGERYKVLKKAIGIAILNFEYFENIEEYHTKWKMTEQKYKNRTLEEQEIHFIEIPKFSKMKEKNMENKLEQWLAFIENKDRGLVEMAKKKNEEIKKAEEKFQYLQGDEALERIAYLKHKYRLDYNSGISDARDEGVEEGESKAKKDTAQKLIKLNVDIEIIKEATGLSEDEIQKLKEEK